MRNFSPNLRLPEKSPRTPLKSEILWGCESGGSNRFPRDMEAIHTRKHSHDPKPLKAFCKAVREAVDRVWLVDEYLLMPDGIASPDSRILNILEWLHTDLVASDIRILTRKHDKIDEDMLLELFLAKEEEINNSRARRTKYCGIQINTCLTEKFNCLHDRFAIVDNELWHFGATVGGFHTKVNAASRGWCAVDSGAIEFFELAWNKCEER